MKSLKAPAITLTLTLAACTNYGNPAPTASSSGMGGSAGSGGSGGFGGSSAGDFVGTGGKSIPRPIGATLDEPAVVARTAPPPLAGGTLLVTSAGHSALVSDPDHDQLFIVDLDRPQISATIALEAGDEPGRAVEDAAGRLHVVLRSGGSVVTVDPAGSVIDRRNVCSYPRGIAYDRARDALQVACAGGELVTLPAGGGSATRTVQLDLDLRDVVIDGDRLLVSRFRAAELLVVEANGEVSSRIKPQNMSQQGVDGVTRTFEPAVAWRTVAAPGGGALMVFQQEQTSQVQISAGGYGGPGGGGCGTSGIVQSMVTLLQPQRAPSNPGHLEAVLAVDLAVDRTGDRILVASAGVSPGASSGLSGLVDTIPPSGSEATTTAGGCRSGAPPVELPSTPKPLGRVVAVGFDWKNQTVIQTREPSSVMVGDRAVILPGESAKDTGHDLFHFATSGGIACASCHPEGREDGHVWTFDRIGPRRTQSVGGGIMDTKPFHWDGDMTDFNDLAHQVFTTRMSGPLLNGTQLAVMEEWIDRIPAWKPAAARDAKAAEHGKLLFNDAQVGCASCHAGAKFTNNTNVDVGTRPSSEIGGAAFQVPSLRGLRWRAPFMHRGCAGTIADRFNPDCGGGDQHGRTSQLSEADRGDLAAYLDTL
jgi:hypothetical protein